MSSFFIFAAVAAADAEKEAANKGFIGNSIKQKKQITVAAADAEEEAANKGFKRNKNK